MIGLDDPIWKQLRGGRHLVYDASVSLRALEAGAVEPAAVWAELWDELHHQSDVDTASYAAVPHIVRICTQRRLIDWNPFALVACIESCRTLGSNPPLPVWLEVDYLSPGALN